jgi:hypothetical protein
MASFYRLKCRSAVPDAGLQVLPLLLERLDKAGVGGLWVPLLGHLCERLDAPDPLCNLGHEPLREGGLGAEEAANVSATIDEFEAEGFKSLLGPQSIFRVADEDTFGRFGEIAPFRPQALEVEHGLGHP